jgi:hypothetical protein
MDSILRLSISKSFNVITQHAKIQKKYNLTHWPIEVTYILFLSSLISQD